MMKVLILMLVYVSLSSCQQGTEGMKSRTPVGGRYTALCLEEGIEDTTKADTSLVITINKDSITFSRQKLANCCGWFNGLSLRLNHDTLKLANTNQDNIHTACDCNCLFEEAITLERSYYDSIGVVNFSGRMIYKYESEIK